jgi:hypothetical protein
MVSAQQSVTKVGEVGERPVHEGGYKMAKEKVQREAQPIPALETGTSVMQQHYICDLKTGRAV